jgi:2-amino-4-hydroxy-6-hydroxymethyldihydropteridine diphosphokinase
MPKLAYLSLGSNLGDRVHYLDEAIRLLQDANLTITRRSSLYETEPRDFIHQPWFLNLVVEAQTRLFPRQLLSRIRRVEGQLGRKRRIAKGPRTIDIDILFFGNSVIEASDLVIPHPRLEERRFVLEPLAELASELRHPVTCRSVRELLARVASQHVTRLS